MLYLKPRLQLARPRWAPGYWSEAMTSQQLLQAVPVGTAENLQLITAVLGLPSRLTLWGSTLRLEGQGELGLSSWSLRACNPQ